MNPFQELLWSTLINAALKGLFALLPALGWGPVGYIVTWVVGYFSDILFKGLSEVLDLEKIAIKNNELRQAYDRASVTLAILARDKGIDSPEYREARNENKDALSKLVRWADPN